VQRINYEALQYKVISSFQLFPSLLGLTFSSASCSSPRMRDQVPHPYKQLVTL